VDERTDATLVGQALAGEREAFSALVRRYQDYAYGIAIAILFDFELARDAVQEAFFCAYRDLRKLRDPTRFAGWLRGIVKHVALRALREIRMFRSLAEEAGRSVEPCASGPAPDESAENAEVRTLVLEALQRLGDKDREAVSLYYVDGLSYSDIAGFLGVTKATVQGRLQRGRERLRRELKMVRDTFEKQKLPEDFAAEIKRLLDASEPRADAEKRVLRRLIEIGAPAVGPLCEALKDPRIAVCHVAARALCAIGDRRALQPILKALFEYAHCGWSWQSAVLRNGRVLAIPGVREALLQVARRDEPAKQWVAILALSCLEGDKEVFETIHDIFRDAEGQHSNARRYALQALCRLAPEAAVDLITQALSDPDARLRASACWLAVRRRHLPPIEVCLNAFGKDMGWWGRVCAGVLVLQHGEEGKRSLEDIMHTASGARRATAAMALARTGHHEAFEVLKSELLGETSDRKWLKAISQTLRQRYAQEVTDWITTDPGGLTDISSVVWTLAKSQDVQAGPMVQELFREGRPTIRAGALRILARQEGRRLLPELRRCLGQGRPRKVAQEAFWAMSRLGDTAIPTAKEMLRSELWTERKAAVCLLRRWGKLTAEQEARAKQDPHVAVQHAAMGERA